MKKYFGLVGVAVLTLLPVAIWLLMLPLSNRFAGFEITAKSLGQITGLLGFTLYAINLILSSRIKFFEDYFWGLNQIYIKHHLIGGISFILLLFHPVFLALNYLSISVYESSRFFLPNLDKVDILTGELSLLGMMILLVLTFFIPLAYDVWKNTHQFLTGVFLIAGLHMLLVTSDVSRNPYLKSYLFVILILSLLFVVYRKFFKPYSYYLLDKITQKSVGVFELILKPNKSKMNFVSGQFAFLSIRNSSFPSEEHPFSMTSVDSDDNLSFLIKSSGDYTGSLNQLKSGSLVRIDGPYGKFSYQNYDNKKQIWIAGGIGITPFLSMARDLSDQDYQIDLFYTAKTKDELVQLIELKNISEKNKNFRIISWISTEKERLTAEIIKNQVEDFSSGDIFICGPKPMMDDFKKQFINLGINSVRIHTENFSL